MAEGKAVSQMFASISGRYDKANHLLSGGIDVYWRDVLARKIESCNPRDIIDVATGSGDVAFKLRDRLGADVSIRGVDFCEPMLEAARQKQLRRTEYSDIEFQFDDCMQLSLPDECTDIVTVAFGVRNFEDRERGLKELLRILRPGGRLFILEFSQPTAWFRPFYFFYLKYILPFIAGFATGRKDAYDYLVGSIEQFPTKEALSEQLKEAGFGWVTARGLTFSIVAIHEAVKDD